MEYFDNDLENIIENNAWNLEYNAAFRIVHYYLITHYLF